MQTEQCSFTQLGIIHRFIQNGRYVRIEILITEVEVKYGNFEVMIFIYCS